MTPERIAELRKWVGEHVIEGQCLVDVDTDEVLDLLDIAERGSVLRMLCGDALPHLERFRAKQDERGIPRSLNLDSLILRICAALEKCGA